MSQKPGFKRLMAKPAGRRDSDAMIRPRYRTARRFSRAAFASANAASRSVGTCASGVSGVTPRRVESSTSIRRGRLKNVLDGGLPRNAAVCGPSLGG